MVIFTLNAIEALGRAPCSASLVSSITLPKGAKLMPLRITDPNEKAANIISWKLGHPGETNLPLFLFDTPDVPPALADLVEFRDRPERTL